MGMRASTNSMTRIMLEFSFLALTGRAKGSPAYNHSLSSGHHVFLSLETAGVFCLPDLYEVCHIRIFCQPIFGF